MHQTDANKTHREKARWKQHKNASCCLEKIPGNNTLQISCCAATYLSSYKPFETAEKYMLGTFREVWTNS